MVAPDDPNLSPEVARYFLSLGLSEEEKSRHKLLASKNQSDLSPAERSELESLVHASTALMLLQSNARLSLRKHQPAA
jgi:hypothetical protein